MEEPKNLDWQSIFQSFQNFKYKGPIGVLAGTLLAIATVFAIVAYRTQSDSIQMFVIGASVVLTTLFFATVVLIIRMLGPYALLSGNQAVSYRKLEMASKNHPSIPFLSPAISDPGGPDAAMIEAITDEEPGRPL